MGRKGGFSFLIVYLLFVVIMGLQVMMLEMSLGRYSGSSGSSFSFTSISEALGQVFYSLSLCMGITITYGSYLKKDENIPKSCAQVAAMDTTIALLAGIAIFPAVFSLGLDVQQ